MPLAKLSPNRDASTRTHLEAVQHACVLIYLPLEKSDEKAFYDVDT
jgi:hypothetical protein